MTKPESQNDQEQSYILTSSGEPFKTFDSALVGLGRKRLSSTHQVIDNPDGGGFVIIAKSAVPKTTPGNGRDGDGQPNPPVPVEAKKATNSSSETTAETEEIYGKPVQVLCPICGKVSKEAEMDDKCDGTIIKEGYKQDCRGHFGEDPSLRKEGHSWVVFSAKSHQNDTEDAELGCNGVWLLCHRGKEVCIPDRFRCIADNALEQKFTQVKGGDRKEGTPIQRYPYSFLRKGTKEEYEGQRKNGDATVRTQRDTAKPKPVY